MSIASKIRALMGLATVSGEIPDPPGKHLKSHSPRSKRKTTHRVRNRMAKASRKRNRR